MPAFCLLACTLVVASWFDAIPPEVTKLQRGEVSVGLSWLEAVRIRGGRSLRVCRNNKCAGHRVVLVSGERALREPVVALARVHLLSS